MADDDEVTEELAHLHYVAEMRREELRKLTRHAERIAADLTAALPAQYQAAGYRFVFDSRPLPGLPTLNSRERLYQHELGQRDERSPDAAIEGSWT